MFILKFISWLKVKCNYYKCQELWLDIGIGISTKQNILRWDSFYIYTMSIFTLDIKIRL